MAKIIKEIIIILTVCLISMLILAIILYDYIPNRKVVAEISTYTTSPEIETQLSDDIDSEEKEVVLTYEVTSKDLNSYEITNEYIPGKANPFSSYNTSVEDNSQNDNTNITDSNITKDDNTNITNSKTTEKNELITDEGIK